jgi:hypothetical protein
MRPRREPGQHAAASSADDDLRRDHRHELGMLWRGLIAALMVVAVVWLRQRYFL